MNCKLNKLLLCLSLICAVACGALGVGVTYARYQSEIDLDSLWFSADVEDRLYLCDGHVTSTQMNENTWPQQQPAWTQTEDGSTVAFCISNGTSSKSYAQRDQLATVRLVAGLGILDAKNLTVKLILEDTDEPVELIAVPELLEEGTPLHHRYGDGWVYRFYEENEEAVFAFDGEELNYQNFTITVTGDADAAMLHLLVAGQYDRAE